MKRQHAVSSLSNLTESIISDSADLFLMFIDLCGSTEYKFDLIKKNIPDITWIFRQLIFLRRCADIIQKHNGTVVKTIGDEIFAYFPSDSDPQIILKCAVEIIQSFDNLKSFKDTSRIEAKASIDVGPTYNGSILNTVKYDPIGTPVDRCARLNSKASENEVIFSEDFKQTILQNNGDEKSFFEKYGIKENVKELKGLGEIKYFSFYANK
jgi:class 3 adenylate cyclase